MSLLSEFREFAVKGNVIDLAVGVIVGAAFGKIVTALTDDVINPLLGLILGKNTNFDNYFINLSSTHYDTYDAAKKAGASVIGIGSFVTAIINFLIMAFIIFLFVKGINRMRAEWATVAPAPKEPPKEEVLLTEIRDLLKAQQGIPPKAEV